MLIRVGYDIQFRFDQPAAVLLMLYTHPTRAQDIRRETAVASEPGLHIDQFSDSFGNRFGRVAAPAGAVRFTYDAVVADTGKPDPVVPDAIQHPVTDLPQEPLVFLLASRYCEVDSELSDIAWEKFGATPPGWDRVQAICDFVHSHIRFDYQHSRPTRTALEGYRERVGVCRDFTHLAITFCRCMNIPARYATGYLGDIGVTVAPSPMDFSAWFEVYLGGRWHTFDARHNARRIGRILMARGRDATDAALTTIFGRNVLEKFVVWADEINGDAPEKTSV
jgi:transglutaminase-like putative cysteine protease